MRENSELRQIAIDLRAGQIFSSAHLFANNHEYLMASVFIPIALADEELSKKIVEDNIAFVFEYMDKAAPRSINGYPMFFSMQMLNTQEVEIVGSYLNKLLEAEANV